MSNVKFAYWVPNVSGGLVVSKLPQMTSWDFEANKKYAQTAERVGFEYALLQTRFIASYGADNQLEAAALGSALAAVTNKINLISAVHPGLWHPAVYAKILSTIDNISDGRVAVNVSAAGLKVSLRPLASRGWNMTSGTDDQRNLLRYCENSGPKRKPTIAVIFIKSPMHLTNQSQIKEVFQYFKAEIPKPPEKWQPGYRTGIS